MHRLHILSINPVLIKFILKIAVNLLIWICPHVLRVLFDLNVFIFYFLNALFRIRARRATLVGFRRWLVLLGCDDDVVFFIVQIYMIVFLVHYDVPGCSPNFFCIQILIQILLSFIWWLYYLYRIFSFFSFFWTHCLEIQNLRFWWWCPNNYVLAIYNTF